MEECRKKLEDGLLLLEQGELEQATSLLEEAALEQPDHVDVIYNLACCYARKQQTDNALFLLERCHQLDPVSLTWALDDSDFEPLHDHPEFIRLQQLLESGNENQVSTDAESDLTPVIAEPTESREHSAEDGTKSAEEDETLPKDSEAEQSDLDEAPPEDVTARFLDSPQAEVPPLFTDYRTRRTAFIRPESDLPPCILCDGLVFSEKRPRHNPYLMLLIVYIGLMVMTVLFISFLGLFGLPIIITGLYLFSRIDDVWVCQNCGAVGKKCGQPSR